MANRITKLTKRGTAKRPIVGPHYPKRYEVVIDLSEDGKQIHLTRRAENLSAYELYGLLKVLALEVERQIMIKPEEELKLP